MANFSHEPFLDEYITNNFIQLLDLPMYSCLYDQSFKLVICTNQSAKSLGYMSWENAVGISYEDDSCHVLARAIFGSSYSDEHKDSINKYAAMILDFQKDVFLNKRAISFFDLLPYNNQFNSYLVTYVPIIDKTGAVVAIQSHAIESKFFGFQEHFYTLYDSGDTKNNFPDKIELTRREEEVMFLLANGLNQEQIAQTLQTSRSTIATIIATKLCVKFNIPGSNTGYLTKLAMERGYFQYIPSSLFKPFVVPMIKG